MLPSRTVSNSFAARLVAICCRTNADRSSRWWVVDADDRGLLCRRAGGHGVDDTPDEGSGVGVGGPDPPRERTERQCPGHRCAYDPTGFASRLRHRAQRLAGDAALADARGPTDHDPGPIGTGQRGVDEPRLLIPPGQRPGESHGSRLGRAGIVSKGNQRIGNTDSTRVDAVRANNAGVTGGPGDARPTVRITRTTGKTVVPQSLPCGTTV
ncbi:hypothetical protein MSMEI_2962 [Mycolicibacterium smegmatis MC2 155]|uniref:Uncharacterized protein n=1 Tax=Mycolicibacterium smegmatis (strain ATCC 700084 / mc(2)155) TaxID=246196 RepID=I7G897_MYCS2|nr:hypothetical protein MSMEI_2962 [Mycolicibacterium smegmatis MC2 155]